MALRMSGITDTRHLDDMLRMNVVPQSWVLKVLSHHYHALQGGGDMSLMLNFNTDALRYGFIIEQVSDSNYKTTMCWPNGSYL